ncbi:MAG: DNA polymerase III subunit gamma/tau [Coprobacillus sp.]|nr:DNA polymerase III subunit gamma/tau [Coprobacillus sp.]
MAYKALYRTYRPMTFDEVAGQEHIVTTIKNALKNNKLAHAYLFAGPRGTGKTTMAKLLAKALNCEEGIGCQCNHCENCVAINEGTHPDVIEIDAASNNGVDDVRDLIDKVKYGSILGKYKVYIIDEVHMMSASAFNALLKTLEEPPENVVFILCTTEPHKVLPTILSRCQRYDFTKLKDEDIYNRVVQVLNKEHIEVNKDAVDLIVQLADGGMRDALSILDQVLAYSNNRLVTQDILNIFSLETNEEKIGLLTDISKNRLQSVLTRLNRYFSKGTDIKRLTDDLLNILKDLLIYQNTSDQTLLQSIKIEDVRKLSAELSGEDVMKYIDAFMEVTNEYKNVSSINPLFEICVLKLCSLNKGKKVETEQVEEDIEISVEESIQEVVDSAPIEEVIEEEEDEPDLLTQEIVIEEKEEVITAPEVNETISKHDTLLSDDYVPHILKCEVKEDHYYLDFDSLINIGVLAKNRDIKNELLNRWGDISVYLTHPVAGSVAALLSDARPLIASSDVLILETKTKNQAAKANLVSNQALIQQIIYQIFDRKFFVYSLNREESVDFQQGYTNRQQVSKLPKPSDIKLEFEGE